VRATRAPPSSSIAAMPALVISSILLFASFFPEVEDPWPDRIDLSFPFAIAGASGMLFGIYHATSPPSRRERAINCGGRIGFYGGWSFYLLSLLVQLVFS
jgi:hypothetical protein